ncbi:MAG TPA: SRPBCC family protein [Streptosporangiaceae bacterium]|jgi:carbon monoxide dehydrogenase subunit G
MGDKTASSITVDAPRAEVMAVIADFPEYPKWAAALRSADVLEAGDDGLARRVRLTLDAGLIKDSYVLAYTWDGDSAVTWELAEQGLVISEMDGGYRLTDRGSGTEVSYELAVGVKMPMLGMLKRKAEKMIIDTALKGLKARAEALSKQEQSDSTGGAR